MNATMTTALICTSALAAAVFVLGFNVSWMRGLTAAVLVAWLQPSWWAAALILGATISRLAHATAMLTATSLADESRVRLTGAIGTYAFGVALAIAVASGAIRDVIG